MFKLQDGTPLPIALPDGLIFQDGRVIPTRRGYNKRLRDLAADIVICMKCDRIQLIRRHRARGNRATCTKCGSNGRLDYLSAAELEA